MFFFFYFEPYIAIVGITEKKGCHKKISQCLQKYNKKYAKDFTKPMKLIQEYEFHGLLNSGIHLMEILMGLEEELYPMKFLWGIGIGKSAHASSKTYLWEADSQAFKNAREAVKYLQINNAKSASARSNYRIICDGDNEAVTSTLNMALMLLSSMKHRWSKRQHEIVKDYMQFRDGQTACAKRLGIAQFSVQKGLAGADFYTYDEVLQSFSEAFEQIH